VILTWTSVNEIFDPDRVDHVYAQADSARHNSIAANRGTNYGVVRINLLERIYENLYAQRIRYEREEDWPHRLLSHRCVTGAEDLPFGQDGIRLFARDDSACFRGDKKGCEEAMDLDLVIVATGYLRNTHEDILKNAQHLMPGGEAPDKRWTVSREYRVQFEPGKVADDAGLWLQGCNERTHGVSYNILLVLSQLC